MVGAAVADLAIEAAEGPLAVEQQGQRQQPPAGRVEADGQVHMDAEFRVYRPGLDYGLGVDRIPVIAPTDVLRRKLLVDNPVRLYWG